MEVVEAKPFMILPPRAGLCQTCARDHAPENPHDASTLFYLTKFKMDTGRDATWEDAMSHCSDTVKEHWRAELKRQFGIDTKSTRVRGNA